MRRILLVLTALLFLPALPAGAQTTTASLDAAAAALRNDPVYVDRSADLAGDIDAGSLRSRIRTGDSPIFVAVLPDVGGDVNQLPTQLAQRVGLRGTYAVVSGRSFRAGSNVLPTGQAGSLATAAFQAQRDNGLGAVLNTFVDRVNQAAAGRTGGGDGVTSDGGDDGGGSGSGGLLLLLAAGGGGLFLWSRSKAKRRRQEEAKEYEADRQLLQAELSVLGQDVMELEPEVILHPDARPDYDAGVTRYQSAKAALDYADAPVDLVRVERVIDEGRYSMARVRARVDGREPPPPPENLTQPGRHGEPAIDLDERGEPVYANYGGMPWYGGGGWFGGGSGLLTGLLLGQMLGGGFGGWGGGYHGGGGGEGDGGDSGGGDWGGGDWGGGDFGGGDFGGGDFGGGGDF